MQIFPIIIVAPNGRKYACFHNAGYAYKWAASRPEFARTMAVRIGHLAGFTLP